MMPKGVLTLEEAAEFLRVSQESVRRLAATNQLPGRLIDGEWRFWVEAVVSWLSGPSDPMWPRHTREVLALERRQAMWPQSDEATGIKWSEEVEAEANEFLKQLDLDRQSRRGAVAEDD